MAPEVQMDKLLTNKGRGQLSALLMLGAALVLFGSMPFHARARINTDFWRTTGALLQFAGIFTIIGIGSYIGKMRLDPTDLLEAAKRQAEEDREMVRNWSGVQIHKISFKQMSWGAKITYAFVTVSGASFVIYGILDAFGFFPPLRVPAADNTLVSVPRWITSVLEIFVGICCLVIFRPLFHSKFVDKWEERFKELLKEIDDEMR